MSVFIQIPISTKVLIENRKYLGCVQFSNFFLAYFRPVFPFYTSKNIGKPPVLWCVERVWKGSNGLK